MTFEEICDKLDNGTPEEVNEAELEIMSRWYYGND